MAYMTNRNGVTLANSHYCSDGPSCCMRHTRRPRASVSSAIVIQCRGDSTQALQPVANACSGTRPPAGYCRPRDEIAAGKSTDVENGARSAHVTTMPGFSPRCCDRARECKKRGLPRGTAAEPGLSGRLERAPNPVELDRASPSQVLMHGIYGQFGTIAYMQFPKKMAHVVLDCELSNTKLCSDFAVRIPGCDKSQNFQFSQG